MTLLTFLMIILSITVPQDTHAATVIKLPIPASGTVVDVLPTSALNVRNGPSLSNAVITTLPNGTTMNITGYTSDGWLEMNRTGIPIGYVSADFVYVPVTAVAMGVSTKSVVEGSVTSTVYTITPACATNKAVTWTSSNTTVATVAADGRVTARTAGTATITVRTTDGARAATCVVTVTPASIAVTGVTLDKATSSLTAGDTDQLVATVLPANATNKAVTWSSSDTVVATVDANGAVTARTAGTATITVRTTDGARTATCVYTVVPVPVPVSGVTLDKTASTLTVGDMEQLVATVIPTDADNKTVVWTSSDTAVATVDSFGTVVARDVGVATITVKTTDGARTATCVVTVIPSTVTVTSVTLDKSLSTLTVGNTEQLTATIFPTNATNQEVEWTSDDAAVATVDADGVVTARSAGTATITVTTTDGAKTATCVYTVVPARVAVTGVTLDRSTSTLTVGDMEQLIATVTPTNADDKAVTWDSSDTSVATVDSFGTVTAKGVGTATITVTTVDGAKVAICVYTILPPIVSITDVSLDKSTMTLTAGDIGQLIATVLPWDATDKTVTWSTSNTAVAIVDTTGRITARDIGTATITVTTIDGGLMAGCTVTVLPGTVAVSGVSLNKTASGLLVGGSEQLIATVMPQNATDQAVMWTSSDTSIVTVDFSGLVSAEATGTATVTATTIDGGHVASCVYTVSEAVIPVTGITLNKSTSSLVVGGIEPLIGTISPANATNQKAGWSSSNTAIATVDATGRVTAQAAGTVTIFVTADDGGYMASCTFVITPAVVPVTGITLNKSTSSLIVGGSEQLTATVSPTNADDKTVVWASSNTAIATVDATGRVTARGQGTATISATTQDGGHVAYCTFTVSALFIPIIDIVLNRTTSALTVGSTQQLIATINPANATNKAVTWSSSHTTIATVDTSGMVTARSAGTATITVRTTDGAKTATCIYTISPVHIPVTGITLNRSTSTLVAGKTEQLTAVIAPTNATNKTMTWSSSNSGVVTVNATTGLVSAVAPGVATITVVTADGNRAASCTFTVNAPIVPVTGVTLSKSTSTLSVGGMEQLFAFVTPTNATNKTVTWSSGNSAIATVGASTGLVTARAAGTVIITATTADGNRTASCTYMIVVPITGVTLNKLTSTLTAGTTERLVATINPSNATNKTVVWSSSNTAIATVDASGMVTAKSAGAATITVRTTDGAKTAACIYTISPINVEVTSVTLNKSAATVMVDGTEQLVATINPANATNKAVTWSSSNAAIATVDATGKVVAKAAGVVTVTVKTVDGARVATCTITVNAPPAQNLSLVAAQSSSKIRVTGVKVAPSSATLNKGGKIQLTATISPASASDRRVKWSSGNRDIAAVSTSGYVTAMGAGTTNIRVTTEDGGLIATCKITVRPSYTIKYYDGATLKATKTLSFGTKIASGYVAPTKVGYIFTGWYSAKSVGYLVTEVTKNQNVYAQYDRVHSVKYYDGSRLLTTKTIVHNKLVTSVYTAPKKAGYEFLGWYTANTGGSKVSTITKNQNVYARYIKIHTIKYYDGSTLKTTKSLRDGTSITSGYTAPKKTGYTFAGWYSARSGGTKVTKATKNQSVYARYNINQYTITYKEGSKNIWTPAKANYNTNLKTGPKKTGHTFQGWYTATSGGTKVTKVPAKNLTVYARYKTNQYTVTYKNESGSKNIWTPAKANYNTNLKAGPKKTGYAFSGWYTAKSGGTKVTKVPAKNLTVYARYKLKVYTVQYHNDAGMLIGILNLKHGASVDDQRISPTKTDYKFVGWFTARTGGTEVRVATKNISVFARYVSDPKVATVTIVSGGQLGTIGSASKQYLGHAFILVENISKKEIIVGQLKVQPGKTVSVGAFSELYTDNNDVGRNGVWYNLENRNAHINKIYGVDIARLSHDINASQLIKISETIIDSNTWTPTNNCSSFATRAFNSVAPKEKQVSAGSALTADTPKGLAGSIRQIPGHGLGLTYNSSIHMTDVHYPKGSLLIRSTKYQIE